MTIKQVFRPAWMATTAVGLLLVSLNVLGAFSKSESGVQTRLPTATDTSGSDTSADDGQPPRRLTTRHFRHSLRMPFFSFQPLG